MNEQILIVEDDPRLSIIIRDYLAQAGFATNCLDNGLDVIPFISAQSPDLIILDLMLPGKDGLNLCQEIRTFSNVPIIMVTARAEEVDRLLGLELGADDYICKPFSPREVVARVKTVLRRTTPQAVSPQQDLVLDEACQKVTIAGQALSLSTVEFKLLNFLVSTPGRIYSRDQLMDAIYPDRRIVTDRTIDSHIKKLRKKIAAAAPDLELIHAVYGAGYKYEPDCSI